MGTTVEELDIATTGTAHGCVTPPEMSLNPPTPPAGPVPVPYPYTARSATASKTEAALQVGGDPVLVEGSVMKVDMPANQPAQPTGGDVVTHAVSGDATTTQGSSSVKSGGKPVCATGHTVRMNLLMPEQSVAQATVPMLAAGGLDMAGDASGDGASKADAVKRALVAQASKKAGKSSAPDGEHCTSAGHPVDVASGAVIDDAVDLELPGAIPLVWSRHYSSKRHRESNSLGRGGWAHSFEQWIVEEDEVLTLRDDQGRDIWFEKVAPGASTFHRRERLTLTAYRSGGFTVHDHKARLDRSFEPLAPGGRAVLRAIRDVYGHAITLEYDAGRLARVIDTAGRQILVRSDAAGRITRLEVWASPPPPPVLPPGAALPAPTLEQWVDYAYHAPGELAAAADALGHADRFEYDGLHRMVKTTLKNGVSFHYEYDEDTGWCVRTWGDGGLHRVDLAPNLAKKQTRISGTNEPKVYTWNDDGVVVRHEASDGTLVGEWVYDEDGYLLAESNGAGETARYEYDERGNRTKVIDPAGNETVWEYADDLPTKRIAPGGLVTAYAHDHHGALVGVTYPSGQSYALGRDVHGRLESVHGGDGLLAGFVYDAHHNVARDVDARGAWNEYVYEALGRPVARIDALGRRTRVEYDRLRRRVAIHFADGTVARAEYEPLGHVCRFTDTLGHVTRMEYAGTGVLARLDRPDGQTWCFGYDTDERLTRIENPRAERYEFDYDRRGRVERETTFDGRVLDYRYSKADRLARVAHPDGTFREFAYDVLGNVVEERAPDGDVVFDRDERGRLLKAILTEYGGKVVSEFERDRLGRIVAETQNGRTIRYEHDARGRRAARILPGGQTTRYHYDPLGALVALDHDGHRVAIERDVLGRETRRHVYRGHVDIQSAYDALDRLTDQRVSAPSPAGGGALSILSQRHFGYDAGGRLTRMDDARWGTTEYRYDAIGQLVEARRGALHEVFEYDVTGSLVNVLGDLGAVGRVAPWFVDTGNILTRTPDAVYENDERGRRIAKIPIEGGEPRPEKATRYGWDSRDRLREVLLPTGERVQYTYDAFGRRVRKQAIPAERGDFAAMTKLALEKGPSALPKPRVTEFLWDGDVLAAELDPERGPRIHVHEPGTFIPALQAEGGEVFTVVNDHLGMPKELVDEDGRVAWAAAHSAWGRVTDVWRDPRRAAKGLPEVESAFRLLGQYADDDVGLCYTRFRWFDPDHARWISPDPLGLRGGGNLLAFCGSPSSAIDPFGLACEQKRGPDGKFLAKEGSEVGPGSSAVADLKAHLQANGIRIVAEEVYVATPFGPRRHDLIIEGPDENLHAIEVKSSEDAFDRFEPGQNAKDEWLRMNGGLPASGSHAVDAGIEGQPIRTVTKVLWPPR